MANKLVDSKSKFNIYSSFILSNEDVSCISLLYAPLIGSDAFLVYMGFESLLSRNNLKSEELTHGAFYDMFSLSEKTFLDARLKLEAIGLLMTYVNSDGNYIYSVLPPLTPKNFIKDASLGAYLYSQVGSETFDYLYNHFKIEKIDKQEYKNITKSFDEVFDSNIDDLKTLKKFDYILGKNTNNSIKVKDINFDFDKFIKEINIDYLEFGITDDFKRKIINSSYVYGFKVTEMVSLYNDSINKFNYFDYSIFKKKANVLFTFLRNRKAPELNTKSNDNIKSNDLISYLDNSSAERIISDLVPNYDSKYLNTVLSIYENIDLPRGVLNCMIIKVLKDKGGDLPSLSYFKKVAESWVLDNVLSTEDAIKYITTLKESKNNIKSESYGKGNYDISGGYEEL